MGEDHIQYAEEYQDGKLHVETQRPMYLLACENGLAPYISMGIPHTTRNACRADDEIKNMVYSYTPPTEKTSACVTNTYLRTLSRVTFAWSVANTITFSHVTMLVNPPVAIRHSQVAHWCIKGTTSHNLGPGGQ